jgi:transcription elongation factor GreA
MTPRGLVVLKEELKQRKEIERPRIVRAIEEARAHGDLSENAEYSAAKEAQSHNEGRVGKLEEQIALADVIDPRTLSGNRIVFGATVTIEDTDSNERQTFGIVGEHEGDIKAGRMSITAPVARALIGRQVGDTVQVKTPRGNKEYEIVAMKFVPFEG